jgi:diguanylate cyclase (GGDEF)-like protein
VPRRGGVKGPGVHPGPAASAETGLEERLKAAESELAFFMELGRELTATLDDRKVLEIIARGVHTYVGPSHTTLFLHGVDRSTYEVAVACGYQAPRDKRPVSILEGIAGEVLRTGHSVRRTSDELLSQPPVPDQVMPGPLAEFMCLPILHRRRALAALTLTQTVEAGPFRPEHEERLTRVLEQSRMAVDRALLYRRTADLAITDDLTQLFNHRYIHQSLDLHVGRGAREDTPISLIFMDLDSFKQINDTHGHLAGSHALTEVAHVLTDNLRGEDIIARYGGDEFVVILPDTTLEVATHIAGRLAESLAAATFLPQLGGLKLTASFGVATYPGHAGTPRKLVQCADQAMYRAKAAGGNRALVYEPGDAP